MSTTPIPSPLVEDFKLNVEDFDAFANGTVTYTDRFGSSRLSLSQFMESIGYEVPVAFADSLSITRVTQTVTYSGNTYHARADAIPFTTTVTFNSAQWDLIVSNPVEVSTHAAASKATPVDADEIPLVDSAASFGLKKLTWANLKATTKTYFDTIYQAADADIPTVSASQAEMEAGTGAALRSMSPLRVKEAIVAISPPTTFASSAENAAGTVENKAVDPLGIREAFNAAGSAPVYACRAWVNFNGTGTVAIMASGNVSSITDNGTGDYTVNFTTALPDEKFSIGGGFSNASRGLRFSPHAAVAPFTAGSARIQSVNNSNTLEDASSASFQAFR